MALELNDLKCARLILAGYKKYLCAITKILEQCLRTVRKYLRPAHISANVHLIALTQDGVSALVFLFHKNVTTLQMFIQRDGMEPCQCHLRVFWGFNRCYDL